MNTRAPNREGDISDAFAAFGGKEPDPLPDRYRLRKLELVNGHEDSIIAGWERLLKVLQKENQIVAQKGVSVIPEVRFSNLDGDIAQNREEIKRRGVAVVRGVIPEDEARSYKFEIEDYVRQNPQTRGFPPENPQLRARTHPNLLKTQSKLITSLWHVADPSAPISLSPPLTYADRLRIRQPGDAKFALGPHQDGGSIERWEEKGYGKGHVYDAIFHGAWEEYDPYEAGGRVSAVSDLYNGLGACSMFRMFQGWLSLSRCGPNQGTLLVNPLLRESTSYTLLRPFFKSRKSASDVGQAEFLESSNWEFTAGNEMSSEIQGANPGSGQEYPDGQHPHLELEKTMVHVPEVRPGDFVIWHCDTIHAVDKIHNGTGDSSVLYIPVCPTTEESAQYVARQRSAFIEGTPGPDFPGGKGESEHVGRRGPDYVKLYSNAQGMQSMGLEKLGIPEGATEGAKITIAKANAALGF
ncbi:hypothetical protein BX600DRAFT_527284 [Xylariales sp. PMI_506]|nr:hypothetical protein BX600DRAFT_527284 [Xylariales sp. PMI_506]